MRENVSRQMKMGFSFFLLLRLFLTLEAQITSWDVVERWIEEQTDREGEGLGWGTLKQKSARKLVY